MIKPTIWQFWRLIAISATFAKYAISAKIATFQRASLPSQGRNMVYGLRAQGPKYGWDQGSEERAQGSDEWDQGSQGF